MATCLAISEDRERLLVRYPSEPLLAEAALSAIADEEILVNVLQMFNEMLKKGFVDAGPSRRGCGTGYLNSRGEIYTENEKKWKSLTITVKELMELLDPAVVDSLQHFVDATVCS
jgi:hypothetical protein